MDCPRCKSSGTIHFGKRHDGIQRFKCNDCGRQFCERTGTFFHRHRFPELVMRIAILINIFVCSEFTSLMMLLIFQVQVSSRSIRAWTAKFAETLPYAIPRSYSGDEPVRVHGDEKFVKVKISKDTFAYWFALVDHLVRPIAMFVSEARDGEAAETLFRHAKEAMDKAVDLLFTDGCPIYPKAAKVFGSYCKHAITGIKGRWITHLWQKKLYVYWATVNPVESLNAQIEHFLQRFHGSFRNIDSANRWARIFLFRIYLQELVAAQRASRTSSHDVNHHNLSVRELPVLAI